MRSRIGSGSHLLPSVLQPGSLDVFEGAGDMVLHVEEDVRVGAEGRGYGAVAMELHTQSRESSSSKEQCGGGRGSRWGQAQHEGATPRSPVGLCWKRQGAYQSL